MSKTVLVTKLTTLPNSVQYVFEVDGVEFGPNEINIDELEAHYDMGAQCLSFFGINALPFDKVITDEHKIKQLIEDILFRKYGTTQNRKKQSLPAYNKPGAA